MSSTGSDLVVESYMIASDDPGVDLYIRNKRMKSLTSFDSDNVLLYVHGSPEPAECSFDLAMSGPSWMDHLAGCGFDVYFVNLRGHGRSTRFSQMGEPPNANAPLLSSGKALADLSRAISHILERRKLEKLHLMGWSRGCVAVCVFAEANPAKVSKIALVGPSYPAAQATPAIAVRLPAYVRFDRETAMDRWFGAVPAKRREGFVPKAWVETWWQANMECDPDGAKQKPAVYRGPCGWYQIAEEYLQAQKPFFYDPANIKNPVLLLVGEWDNLNPAAGCETLFEALTNTPERRIARVQTGTHYMHREKVAHWVIREIVNFLADNR